MTKHEKRRYLAKLLRYLSGCTGWILFAVAGMNAGYLSDILGTAVLMVCSAVACYQIGEYERITERRWME